MAETLDRRLLYFMVSLYIPGFLVMLGFSIVSPVLPLYAQSFGVPYALAAMVITANALGRIVSDIPLGLLCDRAGRRKLIILGSLIATVFALLSGFAQSFPELLVYRLLTGVGMAMWMVARQATIADSISPAIRGRVMSTFQVVGMAGSAAGPAIGGVVAEVWGYRAPFFFYSACTFASLIASLLLVRETTPLRQRANQQTFTTELRAILGFIKFPILMALFTAFATSIPFVARATLIPLYGDNVLSLSAGEIGVILTASTVTNVLIAVPGGFFIDRYGRKAGLVPSFLLSGLVFALFPFSADFVGAVLIATFLGFASGVGMGASMSLAADLAPPGQRGLFLGFWQTIGDLGMAVGPVTLGFLADLYGLSMPFYVTAVLMLVTAATTHVFVTEPRARSTKPL